jgi:hypothetical protein
LLKRGRKFKEFKGSFNVTDDTALVSPSLPYAYKIDKKAKAIAEEKGEKYIGELMTVAEYFNTKVDGGVYAQVRTSPVVDGKDLNVFAYPQDEELQTLVKMFTLDKITDEKTFNDKQIIEEPIEIKPIEIVKEIVSK